MSWLYLTTLIISICGLVVADRRYKLALFFDAITTLKVLFFGVVFFLVWDLLGIGLKIFFVGESQYLTGIRLYHELPIEEVFFLVLLNYTALLLWRKVFK